MSSSLADLAELSMFVNIVVANLSQDLAHFLR